MLLRMAIEMNVSFRSLTECEVLREFLREELGWEMPSRWTLSRLLPLYHLYLLNQLKNKLVGVESLSITTDSTFLTRQQVPYICITGHWIDKNWTLKSAVLAVFLAEQSETAGFIVNKLRDVLETQLGLSRKVHCITTDEGRNFLSAADNLKSAEMVRESLRCACHRIQLMVKKAFMHEDCTRLRALLEKCCAVTAQFKNGWQSEKRNVLSRHQEVYVQGLVEELAALRQEIAHSTRAAKEAEQEKKKELEEAQEQLAKEKKEKKQADRESVAAQEEVADLSIVPHSSELVADDDEDSDDELESGEEPQADADCEEILVSSSVAEKVEEATKLKLFVDFIFKRRALIQRAQTRWMTYVGVVERCVIWRKPLMTALEEVRSERPSKRRKISEIDLSALRISDEEGIVLQQFLVIGRACKNVLESLEGADHTTIGSLLWHHSRLRTFLTSASKNTQLHPMVTLFCQKAVENSTVKFSANVDKAAMIGTVLDPRFKGLSFLSSAEAGKCTDALKSAYMDLDLKLDGEGELEAVQRTKKAVFNDFTSNILDTVSPTRGVQLTELQKYLALPSEERDCNPLDWWRLHASRYPKLAILARRYLAIPASSAASERLFSRLKLTATAARHGLSADTLCMLLFVSCHHLNLSI
jgi:hAT family C-terminal dimerisation region